MNFKIKRITSYILIILLILNVPFVVYLFNFNNTSFNENFYKKEFEKHGVYDKLDDYDIENVNKDVLDYLKNRDNSLKGHDFFNEREKEHLEDVKDLIQIILFIFYFSIILFFVLFLILVILNKKIIKNVGIIFFFGGILTVLDAIIFYLWVKLNFRFAFDLMHKTFFKAGSYVFDPGFEKIVVLYPQQLFYDITADIVINTLVFSFVLFLGGLIVIMYYKKQKII
ncbi:DUF1461 domain-containing protein [Candidatus Woesearchaeota archaeon]|nr:DUF1461 domain-containing protein [Candidatus Woesearchaeota archaeon]